MTYTYLPMKMEQCSETSAYKIQTPGYYPEANIQQTASLLTSSTSTYTKNIFIVPVTCS